MENEPNHPPYKVYRRINGDERASIIGEASEEIIAIQMMKEYADRECFEVHWNDDGLGFYGYIYLFNGNPVDQIWVDVWVKKGEET